MNSFLGANLEALSGRNPGLAERLRGAEGDSARISPGENPALEARCGAGWLSLHSRHDPAGEARRQLEELGTEDSRFVVVLGVGACYVLEEALRRVPADAQVTAIEQDAALFRKALELRDISGVLADKRLTLLVGETPLSVSRELDRSSWGLSFRRPCLLEHPVYAQLNLEYLRDIRKRILELFEVEKSGVATRAAGQKEFTRNILRNLPRLAAAPGVSELFCMFRGKPAVLVSAGPSLNKHLPRLKELQGRAVIICVDTAMRAVLAAGIKPDLVAAVDFTPTNLKHFKGVDTSALPVVAASIVYPACLEEHKGPLFSLFNDYPITDWLIPFLGDAGHVVVGDSTAHTAFHIADNMGCSPLILIGQDLAHTGGRTHADGVATCTAVADRKDGLSVNGWYGDKVSTTSALMTMLKHFEQKIGETKMKVINATEGGARIEGAEHITFEEAARRYCTDRFDAEGAIAAAAAKKPAPDYPLFRDHALLARRRAARARRLAHHGIHCIRRIASALCENRVDSLRTEIAVLDATYDAILMDGELLHLLQGGVELAMMQLRWPDPSAGLPVKHDFLVEVLKDRRFLNDFCMAISDFSKEIRACCRAMPAGERCSSRQTDEWIRHAAHLAAFRGKK